MIHKRRLLDQDNEAFHDMHCDSCGNFIEEGDRIYFWNGDKLCDDCAQEVDHQQTSLL